MNRTLKFEIYMKIHKTFFITLYTLLFSKIPEGARSPHISAPVCMYKRKLY